MALSGCGDLLGVRRQPIHTRTQVCASSIAAGAVLDHVLLHSLAACQMLTTASRFTSPDAVESRRARWRDFAEDSCAESGTWVQAAKIAVLSVAFLVSVVLGNVALKYIPVSFSQVRLTGRCQVLHCLNGCCQGTLTYIPRQPYETLPCTSLRVVHPADLIATAACCCLIKSIAFRPDRTLCLSALCTSMMC